MLGKVGIGLFLIGVLFLLKEAVDREWLTPAVRVGGAGVLGAGLVALGLRLRGARPILGRLLTGGGIAALYGALWTASSLYDLLPAALVLVGMAAVAALALVLASREDDAALSVVGTLGALMTPLLLYRDGGQMVLLIGYTTLVLAGAALVYWRQRWAALIGAMAAGGWGVMLVAWIVGVWPQMTADVASAEAATSMEDRWAFTFGVLSTWVATGGLLLVVREMPTTDPFFGRLPRLIRPEALALFVGPLFALLFLDLTWNVSDEAFAALALGTAVALAIRRSAWQSGPGTLAAAVLVAWTATRFLGADEARTAAVVVALGCALVWLGRKDQQRDVALVGHAVAMGFAFILVLMLAFEFGDPFGEMQRVTGLVLTNVTLAAAVGAGALGVIGFTSSRSTSARAFHLTAAHLVVVMWLRVALGGMENGTALVSAAWGVYGIALVVVGLRLADDLVRGIGLATVLVTVAKVLLFDLSQVPALSRILLFMGLGALLLVVSYFVPSLLKGRTSDQGPSSGDGLAEPPLPPTPVVPERTETE